MPDLPANNLVSYVGYKFVGLCTCTLCLLTLCRVLGVWLYYLCSVYTAGALGFFLLKTFAAAVPKDREAASGPPRHLMLLAFAALEVVVSLILSWF